MQNGEVMTLSLGTRLARLVGLWLLTTLWMGLGLLLVGTLCMYLGLFGVPSLLLLPLLWGYLMREGVQTALGSAAKRPGPWKAAIYIGFACSQLAAFLGLLALALMEDGAHHVMWYTCKLTCLPTC